MGAEDVKNGCLGEDGQLGPDGQKGEFAAQQPSRTGIGPWPGDVATKVKRQAVAERPSGPGSRVRSRLPWASSAARKTWAGHKVPGHRRTIGSDRARRASALDQSPNGQPLAKQPVQPRNVSPEVAAHEDRTLARGTRSLEAFAPDDFKTFKEPCIRAAVEGVVAGQKPCRIRCQLGQEVAIRRSRSRTP